MNATAEGVAEGATDFARVMPVAWMHRMPAYHHGFGMHHAYGGGSWITHMVVSSVIHGLIYSAIFRIMRHLSLGEVLLLVVVVIAVLYYGSRRRGPRQW